MEIAASELDQYATIWGDTDPILIVPIPGVHAQIGKNGVAVTFTGHFGPWGSVARVRIPESPQRSDRIGFRAVIQVLEGSAGIGVTNAEGTDFLAQKLVGLGCHLIEIEVSSSGPAGTIVLRHGSGEAGCSAFILHLLQFALHLDSHKDQPTNSIPHSVFSKIPHWSGTVGSGMTANWLGTVTRSLYNNTHSSPPGIILAPGIPLVNEEYFEWIDLVESVLEAQDKYTMVELGAGWGRWLVNSWSALKQLGKTSTKLLLVGVEAEPTHFEWMKEHFADNGLDIQQHRLLQAAVAATDGVANFIIGHADTWYGQAIVSGTSVRINNLPEASVKEVTAVSLATALEDIPFVDLIDMDIQGAEANVVEASRDLLDQRVKRVHIGTHSHDIEARLRIAFAGMGWRCVYDFPHRGDTITPFGIVSFGDGVQSWINPRYASPAL
jgi:FkbM family methyltransferase